MSEEKHETHAEIIAEMRFHAQQNIDAEKGSPTFGILTMEGKIAKYYADRLEAAHTRELAIKDAVIQTESAARLAEQESQRREIAELKKQIGNLAELREAAVTVYNVLEKLRPFSLDIGDIGRRRQFGHLICSAKNRLDAALAAPPRNCDKYSHDEALRIWSAEPENPMNGCFDVWLYAPATEKEGGVK